MDSIDLKDIENFDFDELEIREAKVKLKTRKRKWREIENIKEVRRLRKELAQYESYEI